MVLDPELIAPDKMPATLVKTESVPDNEVINANQTVEQEIAPSSEEVAAEPMSAETQEIFEILMVDGYPVVGDDGRFVMVNPNLIETEVKNQEIPPNPLVEEAVP